MFAYNRSLYCNYYTNEGLVKGFELIFWTWYTSRIQEMFLTQPNWYITEDIVTSIIIKYTPLSNLIFINLTI